MLKKYLNKFVITNKIKTTIIMIIIVLEISEELELGSEEEEEEEGEEEEGEEELPKELKKIIYAKQTITRMITAVGFVKNPFK
jgi:hypothetical protein